MSLRDRFHGGIAKLVTTHPRWVVFVAVVLTIIAGRQALYPLRNIDTDILRQLPPDMPEVQAYRAALEDYGAFDHLYGVIEVTGGTPNAALLIKAAEELAQLVDDPEFVFDVQWALDPDTQDHYGAATGFAHGLLIPPEQWPDVEHDLFGDASLRRRAIRMRELLQSPLPASTVQAQLENPWRLTATLRRHLLSTRGPVAFDHRTGHFLSDDGQMILIVIRPVRPATDLLFSQNLLSMLNEAAERVTEIHRPRRTTPTEVSDGTLRGTLQIGFIGLHAETLYDTTLLRKDVVSTALASGILVMILFSLAFRRWSAFLFVGIPLIIGITWTLGLVTVFIGHLTIVTCSFAAIVLGLGIDFGIHLYNRFLEDRLEGNPSRESVQVALVEVGPGVFTGAVTTALAFFALLLTDFPGFRELGVIGGTGVLCCLASMYFVMPSLLMVLHHRQPRSKYTRLTSFGLESLADAVSRRPRSTILAILLLTAWLGFLSLHVEFDDNLFHLRDPSSSQIALRNRVDNRFELPGQPLLITVSAGPDLQAALEVNDFLSRRLVELGDFFRVASIDSLRTLLPSVVSQNQTRAELGRMDLTTIETQFQVAVARVGLSPSSIRPAMERLRNWWNSVNEAPPLRLSLASRRSLRFLVSKYVISADHGFRVMMSVFPQGPRWQDSQKAILFDRLGEDLREHMSLPANATPPLEFTGVTALMAELRQLIKRDLAMTVFFVTIGVFAVLWFHFRSLRRALLVTVPALTAVLWTLGLMALTGNPLNFINVLALPIIIGLGIDNSLHIIERYQRAPQGGIEFALVRTGRAVVVTSLSTILGFGALSLASFRGIQQLGVLAIVGVGLSLITAITLVPALIAAMGDKGGWRSLIRPDER